MKFITLTLLLLLTSPTYADIVVIGNIANSNPMMSAREVQEIYMGRHRAFSDNMIAYPIDNQHLRNDFYQRLTNRPIEQINAYWARLKFSGQSNPPVILSESKEIINKIKNNKNAIAYINSEDFEDKDIRILFTFE